MRHVQSFSEKLLNGWHWFTERFHKGVIFVGRWLDLQHITALMLMYFAWLFVRQTPTVLNQAMTLLSISTAFLDPIFVFALASGALIGKPVSSTWYRFWTLPMVVYGLIYAWYAVTHNGVGATTAGFGIGLWAILQVIVTVPRQGGDPDADRIE